MPLGWGRRLFGIGVLGGVQGAIGWWMVSSGLGGRMVDVASYRLAIHLGLAFAILGFIAWFMLSLARSDAALLQARRLREKRLVTLSNILATLVFLQILLGALVAGIDAGRAFPTWPLMGETFFPADAFYLPGGGPAVLAFFENAGLVQFTHRMAGYLVLLAALFIWWRGRASAHPATERAFDWVAVAAFGQVVLGIVTVVYGAPLHLGLIHQLGAVILWVLILRARHRALYPVVQSVRGRA
jgi:cytochrome c oxidase assembly protein subunit 15